MSYANIHTGPNNKNKKPTKKQWKAIMEFNAGKSLEEIAKTIGTKDKNVMTFIANGLKKTAEYTAYLAAKMPNLMKIAPTVLANFTPEAAVLHCLIREEEAPDKIKPLWFRTATDIQGFTGRNAIEPLGIKDRVNVLIADNRRQIIKNIQTNVQTNIIVGEKKEENK